MKFKEKIKIGLKIAAFTAALLGGAVAEKTLSVLEVILTLY